MKTIVIQFKKEKTINVIFSAYTYVEVWAFVKNSKGTNEMYFILMSKHICRHKNK